MIEWNSVNNRPPQEALHLAVLDRQAQRPIPGWVSRCDVLPLVEPKDRGAVGRVAQGVRPHTPGAREPCDPLGFNPIPMSSVILTTAPVWLDHAPV